MNGGEPTFQVPVSYGSRLHFSWGLGSELHFIDVRHPSKTYGGDGGHVTRVRWGQPSTHNRNISFSTMEHCTEVMRSRLSETRDDAHLTRVAAYARKVRESLMDTRQLDEAVDGGQSLLDAALWHLLEIFFVDAPRHEGNLGEDFVQWLSAHSGVFDLVSEEVPLNKRMQELMAAPSASAQPDYWAMVARLVALGSTSEALGLLDCHDVRRAVASTAGGLLMGGSAGQTAMQPSGMRAQLELIDCLHVLLKRLPRLAPSGGRGPSPRAHTSLAEYAAARALWLREVQDVTSAEVLFAEVGAANQRTAEGVRVVLAVMQGQPAALQSACCDWLELAAAEVVHRRAGGVAAANQLRVLLAECRDVMAGSGSNEDASGRRQNGLLDFLARLLEALTDTDIAGVISEVTSSCIGWSWLLTHSLELMAAYPGAAAGGGSGNGGGLLTRRLDVSGCNQIEYFRLGWADSLLQGCMGGGWQLALDYLAWCPQHGAAAAEVLIEALPVDSRDVRTLEKALTACRRLGLPGSAAVLCRMAGVDALSRGQLGTGAQWMVRATDPRRTAAALQLIIASVEEALISRLGTYRAGPLALPGGDELEALLEWLHGGGGGGGSAGGGSEGEEVACGGGGRGGMTLFLLDMLRLSRAMGALAEARDNHAPPDDVATLGSLTAGRVALMSMVHRRSPPRRLCMPLLFYVIPLLEASAEGGRLFSFKDVKELVSWAGECARGVGAASTGAGIFTGPTGQALGFGVMAVVLGVPERYARDVQLALVRASARSHILQ